MTIWTPISDSKREKCVSELLKVNFFSFFCVWIKFEFLFLFYFWISPIQNVMWIMAISWCWLMFRRGIRLSRDEKSIYFTRWNNDELNTCKSCSYESGKEWEFFLTLRTNSLMRNCQVSLPFKKETVIKKRFRWQKERHQVLNTFSLE